MQEYSTVVGLKLFDIKSKELYPAPDKQVSMLVPQFGNQSKESSKQPY